MKARKFVKISALLLVCAMMIPHALLGAFAEETVPETTAVQTTAPETTAPETTAPETTVPATSEPKETEPPKAEGEVTAIEVSVQPQIKYKDGDKLYVSCMKVKLTYDNGTSKEIGFNDFAKNGITAKMANGADCKDGVIIKHVYYNTGRVVVTYGDLTAYSKKLQVSEGDVTCEHTNTKTETVNATCKEAGSEKVVCEDCGQTVSEKELPIDENAHVYGEWTVEKEATATETGSRKHTCTLCGFEETEEIPAVETTAPKTEAPETTAPITEEPETTAPVTDEGDIDNKNGTKTVLIVVMIFLVIAIIIVIAAIVRVKRSSEKDEEEDPYDEYEEDDQNEKGDNDDGDDYFDEEE